MTSDHGECLALPLPPDATGARVARSLLRAALPEMGLPGDRVHDGLTMASELAANAHEHALANRPTGPEAIRRGIGVPELWLYRTSCRIVCKVFDPDRTWKSRRPREAPLAEDGRGLALVHALSAGEWGWHLTRSRLGAWRTPGKAVYFRMAVPALAGANLSPAHVAARLHMMLAGRGIDRVYRRETTGLAVLSVRTGLTIFCYADEISWSTPSGDLVRRPARDLVDVAEEIVQRHEEGVGGERHSTVKLHSAMSESTHRRDQGAPDERQRSPRGLPTRHPQPGPNV